VHYQNGISALYTKSNEHSDMQEPVKWPWSKLHHKITMK
jgi:hypothetical protein